LSPFCSLAGAVDRFSSSTSAATPAANERVHAAQVEEAEARAQLAKRQAAEADAEAIIAAKRRELEELDLDEKIRVAKQKKTERVVAFAAAGGMGSLMGTGIDLPFDSNATWGAAAHI